MTKSPIDGDALESPIAPTMLSSEFDLDDLSKVIDQRATIAEARGVAELERSEDDSGAITLQIEVPVVLDTCDEEVEVLDALLGTTKPAFRDAEGLFLRHRVAVLGVGSAVDGVHKRLKQKLASARHEIISAPLPVDARYDVALFGGNFQGSEVSRDDAELLGDRLATYRANCLVVVNAGAVKARFADRSAQQLALLTHFINRGALVHGQRPYALVFVVDEPIPQRAFNVYVRACQQLGTPAAMIQLAPDAVGELMDYIRFELTRYSSHHLSARRKAGPILVATDEDDDPSPLSKTAKEASSTSRDDAPLIDEDDIIADIIEISD